MTYMNECKANEAGVSLAAQGACDPGTGGNEPAPTTHIVRTQGLNFVPDQLNIAVGDIVEFTLGGSHNAVEVSEATYNSGGSAALAGGFSVGFGQTSQVTFSEAGTYYYACTPHASSGMVGMIIVE